ncbi:MAG: UDP-N-acetylglucosamine 1-carboxyvinyltransferase, partial [bacterium]|nr:UDP-N-acetylglucosamine 1-carboxyvinyltransferase [bacterium]
MSKLLIRGGQALSGTVPIMGMKNSATKLIAATVLTDEPCILRNVPHVRDVVRMVELVSSLGAKVRWEDPHTLHIQCANISLATLDRQAVKSMRSSLALLGPMLARFRDITLPEPGGDNIGRRPIDSSTWALQKLGAKITREDDIFHVWADALEPATIILPEFSVGATENALMAAALTPGETIIKLAAVEPSVQDLMAFLRAMGADVREVATHTIAIRGKKKLHGVEFVISPDNLEIGTFAIAAAATGGSLELLPVVPFHIESMVEKLKSAGVAVSLGSDCLRIEKGSGLRSFKL